MGWVRKEEESGSGRKINRNYLAIAIAIAVVDSRNLFRINHRKKEKTEENKI